MTTSTNYVLGSSVATQNGVSIDGPALVCFSAMGKLLSLTAATTGLAADCTAGTDDTSLSKTTAYTLSRTGAQRQLKVQVFLGGRVRMCDVAKTLSNDNPDGCPAS